MSGEIIFTLLPFVITPIFVGFVVFAIWASFTYQRIQRRCLDYAKNWKRKGLSAMDARKVMIHHFRWNVYPNSFHSDYLSDGYSGMEPYITLVDEAINNVYGPDITRESTKPKVRVAA